MNGIRAEIRQALDARSEKRTAAEAEILKLNDELKAPEVAPQKKTEATQIRQEKIAALEEMKKELEAFTNEQDKSLKDETQRLRDGAVAEIKAVVEAQARSKGLDLVFDTSGNSISNVPVVVSAANSTYDFTETVLTILNATRPKTAGSEKREQLAAH